MELVGYTGVVTAPLEADELRAHSLCVRSGPDVTLLPTSTQLMATNETFWII